MSTLLEKMSQVNPQLKEMKENGELSWLEFEVTLPSDFLTTSIILPNFVVEKFKEHLSLAVERHLDEFHIGVRAKGKVKFTKPVSKDAYESPIQRNLYILNEKTEVDRQELWKTELDYLISDYGLEELFTKKEEVDFFNRYLSSKSAMEMYRVGINRVISEKSAEETEYKKGLMKLTKTELVDKLYKEMKKVESLEK